MLVTIIADASHSPHTDRAAWAGSIVCNRGRFKGSGGIRARAIRSGGAELISVWNSIMLARNKGLIMENDTLILQNDNARVVKLMQWAADKVAPEKSYNAKIKNSDSYHWWLECMFWEYLTALPCKLYVKHVKGHLTHAERHARHHVQEECDREAKRARLEFEKEKMDMGYRGLIKVGGKTQWLMDANGKPVETTYRDQMWDQLSKLELNKHERKPVPWWIKLS
jgi:ribonuclease HI